MDTERMEQYARVKRQIRALEADLKNLKVEALGMESELIESFITDGLGSVRLAGGEGTLALRKTIYATPVDRATACDALVAAGHADMVERDFNKQTAHALVREYINAYKNAHEGEEPANYDDALPEPMRGAFDITEKFELRVTQR